MAQRAKLFPGRQVRFDQEPGRFEIPMDDRWITPAGADKCQPEFEDQREHEKRSATRSDWTKAIFWVGCSVGLAVAGVWAITSI